MEFIEQTKQIPLSNKLGEYLNFSKTRTGGVRVICDFKAVSAAVQNGKLDKDSSSAEQKLRVLLEVVDEARKAGYEAIYSDSYKDQAGNWQHSPQVFINDPNVKAEAVRVEAEKQAQLIAAGVQAALKAMGVGLPQQTVETPVVETEEKPHF